RGADGEGQGKRAEHAGSRQRGRREPRPGRSGRQWAKGHLVGGLARFRLIPGKRSERPRRDALLGPASERCGTKEQVPEMAMTPPTDLSARVIRYRCCLPALAGFSN